MVSYEALRKNNEVAANLIRLWAYLDNKGLWFGLFGRVSEQSSSLSDFLPRWFHVIISCELKFLRTIQDLLAFSMIEAREDLSAYTVHPVVHEWALQGLAAEGKGGLA